MPEMIVQIKDDKGVNRLIGVINNRVFSTERQKSKHLFRKLNAWGLDSKVLDAFVKKKDVDYIIIHEKEEQTNYVITPQYFREKGQVLQFGRHRPQYFLPIYEWEEIKGGTIDVIIQQYQQQYHQAGHV